ncbi:hypothetical protein GYMLUDRAFT_341325 [Collybiopsis luxurians FD-317 M1]|uniref:Uncharacterized protein n=1 Tax=Collybiopsis luxurians FD-317 M1 TaxID=944289 RepID=A0A0D0C195_9AGAR|nr:hypothetical protein GYMLUDRAFT_394605 [Collybiopsis luxurians FD-317 M1]KIK71609.1 hypothetical protein GYMLUDRAFT_341325 [Collybiopsis luxurians FD-317 M1]
MCKTFCKRLYMLSHVTTRCHVTHITSGNVTTASAKRSFEAWHPVIFVCLCP